jgi:hypothetical protein
MIVKLKKNLQQLQNIEIEVDLNNFAEREIKLQMA